MFPSSRFLLFFSNHQTLSQPKSRCNDSGVLNLHHGCLTMIMTSRRLFHHNPVSRGKNQPIRKSESINYMKVIIKNSEKTGFLMWLSCQCISCLEKPTKKSEKYMYSLLVYNENHIQLIQYTKNINGTASHVEAISCIQKKYKSAGHYKIKFVSCSRWEF